jgi:hypothetical protein
MMRRAGRIGFTLVELPVVITIIGTLKSHQVADDLIGSHLGPRDSLS